MSPTPVCMCMQGRGSAEDAAGARAYLAIQDELEDYANAHPEIRPIIDPLYLVSGSALKLAGPDGMGLSDRSRGNILFILGKCNSVLYVPHIIIQYCCPSQEADVATGNGRPGHLIAPTLPDIYPPSNSVTLPTLVPVGLGGSTWTFVGGAAGREQASHLAGTLQALNPGLKVKIYNTGTKLVTHL